MNKKYIWWELKRVIVPFTIVLGAFFFSSFITIVSANLYKGYAQPVSPMSLYIGLGIAIGAVFPLFVMQYKFGLIRADFYRQLPFGPRRFKQQTLIAGLVFLLIGVSILYILQISTFTVKYFLTPDSYEVYGEIVYKMDFNFIYLAYGYLCLILSVSATYFISALMVNYNSNVWESIVCIVLGQLFLLLVYYAPASVIRMFINENALRTDFLNFSFVSGIIAGNLLDKLAIYGIVDNYLFQVISFVGYLLVGGGSAAWVLMSKDKSAELTNAAGNPNIVNTLVIHFGFGSILLIINMLSGLGTSVFTIVLDILVMVAYFFFNVMFRHGFKLKMMQYIPYICVCSLTFVICIILPLIYN